MFKKISTLTLGALSLVTLASACSVDIAEPQEFVDTNEEAVNNCSNDQATWSIMAALAEATADEIGRWQPRKDFQWNWSANNGGGALELTSTSGNGVNHCIKNSCKTVKSLLALQSDAAAGLQIGGFDFRPELLRNRAQTYWARQQVCLDRPDNGMGDNCPAEQHKLGSKTTTMSATTCAGGIDINFKGTYESNGAAMSAADAAQLKNMLIFLGGRDNTYLQFNASGDTVKIDPIDGTTGGSSSGSGSCELATGYNASTNKCDATNVAKTVGSCCSCNNVNLTWQPKPLMAGWFVCKA